MSARVSGEFITFHIISCLDHNTGIHIDHVVAIHTNYMAGLRPNHMISICTNHKVYIRTNHAVGMTHDVQTTFPFGRD